MRNLLLITAFAAPLLFSTASHAMLSQDLAAELETNSQTWRSQQPSEDYVIQLLSVRDTKSFPTVAEIRQIKQVDPSKDVVYHPKRVNGVTWHTIVWGAFDTKAEGQAMFGKLPARWQKMKPWVRPMSSIKGAAPVAIAKVAAKPTAPAAKPTPRPAPKAVVQPSTKKHPVSAPNRSSFPAKPPAYEDPYENYGEDFSNHESAMAAQGTYPYLKISYGQAQQGTGELKNQAIAAGTNLNGLLDEDYSGAAYEIAVGLDFGYYLGAELGYIDATNLAAEIAPGGAASAATAKAFQEAGPFGFKGFKGSLVVKLPIDARRQWQSFVQVGAIKWESEVPALGAIAATENKSTDLFYSAGLDYKFNKKWALGLKYTGYEMEADTQAITADLTWRWEGRQ